MLNLAAKESKIETYDAIGVLEVRQMKILALFGPGKKGYAAAAGLIGKGESVSVRPLGALA